jgi:hypothetical protein
MGDIPLRVAAEATRILRDECMPVLFNKIPWLEEKLKWDSIND